MDGYGGSENLPFCLHNLPLSAHLLTLQFPRSPVVGNILVFSLVSTSVSHILVVFICFTHSRCIHLFHTFARKISLTCTPSGWPPSVVLCKKGNKLKLGQKLKTPVEYLCVKSLCISNLAHSETKGVNLGRKSKPLFQDSRFSFDLSFLPSSPLLSTGGLRRWEHRLARSGNYQMTQESFFRKTKVWDTPHICH